MEIVGVPVNAGLFSSAFVLSAVAIALNSVSNSAPTITLSACPVARESLSLNLVADDLV